MKNRFIYLTISVLIISNLYFIYNDINKSKIIKNSDFNREMNYLKKRLSFDNDQIKLAQDEYKRYSTEKKKIERKFRRYDLIIMDNLDKSVLLDSTNKENYYNLAIELNKEKMNHWIKIREIANEDQIRKLDSIWSRTKERINKSK